MEKLVKKTLKHLDRKGTINLVRDLIRIPSHRDIPEQESKVAKYIAQRLEKSGINVQLREVTDGRPNIVAIIKGSGGGYSLTFNGHTDTVPVYGWKIPDPRALEIYSGAVREGVIYGRGSVDMKGGLGAMIVAMEAIKKSGVDLKGDLVFTGVVGEEGSCSIGTKEILRNGPKTDFVLVGEATRLNVEIANKGSWDFTITVHGRTAHSGQPEKGINAVVKMAEIVKVLEKEVPVQLRRRKHRLLGYSVMNISKIEGGIYGDVVPDLCKLSVRIRYTPVYTRKKLEGMISEILQRLQKKDPELTVEMSTILKHYPWKWGEVTLDGLPREISKDNILVKTLRRNVKMVTGKYPKIRGSKGWSDSALFTNEANIPAVNFGPGNGGAHSPTECLKIDQLHKAAEIFTITSLDICNMRTGK